MKFDEKVEAILEDKLPYKSILANAVGWIQAGHGNIDDYIKKMKGQEHESYSKQLLKDLKGKSSSDIEKMYNDIVK